VRTNRSASAPPRYAVITGNGRSGTNWLESILDASPLTHCRSEPYDIPTSPFHKIPHVWKAGKTVPDMDRLWDEVVMWSRNRIGQRDHPIASPKRHVYRLAQASGIARLIAHSKSRRMIAAFQPSLRQGEWQMPWWIGSQRRLEQAYPVFKTELDHRMVSWILTHRPQVKILHIVRHPCGRLNSWLSRYVARRNTDDILAVRKDRLHKIGEADPEWLAKFGDVDALSLVESEVWFWRYLNESVYAAGRGYPAYLRLTYEDLVANPLAHARTVYNFCELPWDAHIETIVTRGLDYSIRGKLPGTPSSVARAWKTRLSPEHIRTVETIVHASPIMEWWEKD
jgi:Sulfotransferase family